MHLRSIRARILAGFATLILLQGVVAISVWRAENRVDLAIAADAQAVIGLDQAVAVRSALNTTQWHLAEFVRTGSVVDRDFVDASLVSLSAAIGNAAGIGAASGGLRETVDRVQAALKAVFAASTSRRDALEHLLQAVNEAANGLPALAQAAVKAPDRPAVEAMASVLASAVHPVMMAQRFAVSGDDADIQAATTSSANVKETLKALQGGGGLTPRIQRMAGTIGSSIDALSPAMESLGKSLRLRSTSLAALDAAAREGRTLIAGVLAKLSGDRQEIKAQTMAARLAVRTTVLAAAAASGLIGVALAILVGLSITRPISRLSTAMRRIADGSIEIEVPDQSRRDEVGAMAAVVQTFKAAAIEKGRLERQAEMDRRSAEQERSRTEEERRAVADQQAAVVESLAAALGRLSAGDLTCDMTVAFAPEYERLRTDFNKAVAELREVIGTIVININAIRAGTGDISRASDDLSRRTEHQAASLEQTAAALHDITATVGKTAQGTKDASDIVAKARVNAGHSEEVVRDAVNVMSEIEQSANKVSEVIGLIDSIAFQTNLLALNAGVEAARAGDAGRGFAVVASEVRALAQRSADAAKEIKALISASGEQVVRGVALVGETGKSLGMIVGQVNEISAVITAIASSAQEQASGLGPELK
jgi:methyl-accepting chemotaxis protein